MEIDTRGEICPYPMLAAKKAMERGEEEILLLTDHPSCLETVPREAQRLGYQCQAEKAGNGQWRLTLRRKPLAAEAGNG